MRTLFPISAWSGVCLAFLAICAPAWGAAPSELPDCPATPNCVSSLPSADAEHRVPPLTIAGSPEAAWNGLKQVLHDWKRMAVALETDNAIHAEATSAAFRFVDDVDFRLDPAQGLIHVRSASRVGYWDLGVNRRRVEELRERLVKLSVVR
jgi:uncharacterized protein (DUF1499 family)